MFFLYVLFVLAFNTGSAANNEPIVLVHGLAGSENTWDYATELQESGFRTIAVTLNPFESNYDRAVELFALLKGTRMDYGICHSEKFGHNRFGKDYTGKGLYPEWDENHKIHLIGHSLGGQTIRMLEKFLEEGNDCSEDNDFLFQGGKNWITSITTMASPLDGTSAFDFVPFFIDELVFNQFVNFFSNDIESLAFPQWGLEPQEGESKSDYLSRVAASGITTQEDFSFFDLSIRGANRFNRDTPQVFRRDRFYFAFALERTSPTTDCELLFMRCDTIEEPDSGMSFSLKVPAKIIGSNSEPIDRPNDGIVNQNRAKCPGNTNRCYEAIDDLTLFGWTSGLWHYVKIDYLDHFQVTGRDTINDVLNFQTSARRLYLQHGVRLNRLPSGSLALPPEEEFIRSEKADTVERYFEAIKVITNLENPKSNEGISAITVAFIVIFAIAVVAVGINKFRFTENFNCRGNAEQNQGDVQVVSV